MTPVILLADGYLSNAAEPWRIPEFSGFSPIEHHPAPAAGADDDVQQLAFTRDAASYGRPWITPGMPELMYRVGGLEKDLETGHISYDPANHQDMTEMRFAKVASVAEFIPEQEFESGPDSGKLVVVGWGSTHGPIYQAARQTGVSFIHLRHINPLPKNLGALLARFEQVLVPEMNAGQLSSLLRDKLCIAPVSYSKVTGQPFRIAELVDKIQALLKGASS